ncbi:MAG: hypothetical protein AUJ97_05520 [Bacteroidetes bacterium CG2_30_32_10]|nr:MAG: hypothetical protein AUJ97_05520 [Bacteroidetes bacterium CG2_30_32_10]
MKMKAINILFLIVSIFFISCNNNSADKPKEDPNIIKTYREDGTLLASYSLKNGKKEGKAYNYYKNDNVNFEFFYVNGLKEGIVKRFYEDGKLYSQTPYLHDTIDGVRKIYYKNGIVSSEIPYNKGNIEPGLKEYETDGKLKTKEISIIVNSSNNKIQLTTSNKSKNARFFQLTGAAPFYKKNEIPTKQGIAMINKNSKEARIIEAQITTDFGSLQIIRTTIEASIVKK